MRHPAALLIAASSLVLGAPLARAQTATRLWEENCMKCHGEKGEGGGAGTRTLLIPEKRGMDTDRAFFDIIKNGSPENGMEAYGGAMTDPQIWSLVVHIRELQARDQRAKVGKPRPEAGVYKTQRASYKVEQVVSSGVEVPWAVDFLPDGTMLVTERNGKLRTFKDGVLSEPLKGTPEVRDQGQGGLMDVTVHYDYAKNGWVYLAFSEPLGAGGRNGMTQVVRGRIKDSVWTEQETIFRAREQDYSGGGVHFGCQIVFDRKGHVFFGIGERGLAERSQDLKRPNGKVYRLHEDGTVPKDNPFVGQEGVYEAVWSYGHRNPQGLVFDLNGNLWDTEHGPRGGDELNIIEKGRNYGWPVVSYGINYSDQPFKSPFPGEEHAALNIKMPVDRWLPSIGACGMDVCSGKAFKQWEGDLLAGGLSGNNVDRIRVAKDGDAWKVVEREEIVFGMGRVRGVTCGPDGFVYVVLNGPDKIVRLVPADEGKSADAGTEESSTKSRVR
ncbi:MAG TPA: PQQ-dependent sugar dehydrogenase [Phycisphaerales bacterium]|nr:PQQ-dependent sugar dehydrogenase [Phycisphaerales bacterium]